MKRIIWHVTLGLTSFIYHVFKVHPCCSIYQYCIPFYCQIIFHWMDILHFIYSAVDGHLSCSHIGAIMNNDAMNIMYNLHNICGYMDDTVTLFNSVRKWQTVFHNGYTFFTFSAMYEGPNFFSSSLTFVISHFKKIIAILVGVKWYHIVVLICISLLTIDIEHLFRCLLGICVSSLENCLSKPFAPFQLGCFFHYWDVNVHIFWTLALVRYMNCKHFLPLYGLPFYFLDSLFMHIF